MISRDEVNYPFAKALPERFAILATASSVAQLTSVRLTPTKRVFHPAIVFVVAGALLLSPQQLVLMCVVQHVPEWLSSRKAWYAGGRVISRQTTTRCRGTSISTSRRPSGA